VVCGSPRVGVNKGVPGWVRRGGLQKYRARGFYHTQDMCFLTLTLVERKKGEKISVPRREETVWRKQISLSKGGLTKHNGS